MKTRSLPLAVFLLVLPLPVRAADWPQWRGPDRSDVAQETGLLKDWPKSGPKLLWTFTDAGTGMAGFAVVGDRLFTMGADDKSEYVFALDLKTHKKAWSTEIGPRFINGWCDGPRGTPTVDGDLLYALGGQGNLICVKTTSGEKVWEKSYTRDLGGNLPMWGFTESPLVDGDRLICTPGGSRGTLAALDKKTGEVIWRSKEITDGAEYASVVPAEIGGVRQYVQMTVANVFGVDARDGRLLWKYSRPGKITIPTPIVADNRVYVTSGYSKGYNLIELVPAGKDFQVREVAKGSEMTNHHGGVIKVGDYLYGHSDSGGWTCQEFKTGKVVWSERNKLGKGSVTCADGMLYCYSERDGTVVLIEASPKGWIEHGRFTIPAKTKLPRKRGQIWTHPVVANGKLYLRDQDLIFCYDVKNGAAE
jgi:outer membrane protein assembly factor BamB